MTQTIGVDCIPGWADWEAGLLTGAGPDWFGGKVVAISPDGEPVRSIGGLLLTPERSADPAENEDLDAVVAVGSEEWAGPNPPDIAPLLNAVAGRGGVTAGICAGTLALARAGLFAEARHTSNEQEWLDRVITDYPGRAYYRQSASAVADGRVISAPGSAPGTFAIEVLKAVFPDKAEMMPQLRAMFSAEYAS